MKVSVKVLTKSDYLAGLACVRYLYKCVNESESLPKATIIDEFRIEQGKEVEVLAKRAYGHALSISPHLIDRNLEQTANALERKKTLLEPGFLRNSVYARIDALIPVGNHWDIVEIKSSSRAKKTHIRELAFQKFCVAGSNLRIGRCYVRHLNPDYLKHGKLNLEELFIETDVTEEVDEIFEEVIEEIEKMKRVISSEAPPEIGEEPLCIPNQCPIKESCWNFLPENNVFELYYGRKKAMNLYKRKVLAIKDIPASVKLTKRQDIQKQCADLGEPHVAKLKLKGFLSTIKYPIYFLDFETISPAIPMFDNSSPHMHVPFQFSLHVVQFPGAKPVHHEYLYSGKEDPRPEFLTELKKVLGDSGSVVVYYQRFEIPRLKELAKAFPEYSFWVEGILSRIVDLIIPFQEFYYYNERQRGSASLKRVLPVLTDLSYDDMEIAEGLMASTIFFNLTYKSREQTEEEIERVRKQLLEYCKLDTFAEVAIFNSLTRLVKDV